MSQHGGNDLPTTELTLDTLGLSKAQKHALYTLIASVRPKPATKVQVANLPEAHGYNQALQDYDNAIKDLLE